MAIKNGCDYSQRFEEFKQVIRQSKDDIYVVLAQLDPDAIGAAALFRTICRHFERKIKIRYAGALDHPQNECIFNVFELDKTFARLPGTLPEKAEIALLDSAMTCDARMGCGPLSPKYIIDHHMSAPEPPDNSWYFIESFGSCCTILSLMIKHFQIEFDETDDAPTLGAIGIYGDTDKFKSAATTEPDIEAFYSLMRYGDWEQFRRVNDFKFPSDYYRILEVVLRNSKVNNTVLVSCAGYLKEDQGVYLAIIADELMRQEGISTVITWGVLGDHLIVKARSSNNSIRLDRFLKEKFGETCAGAKSRAGGANVHLGFMSPQTKNREALLRCLDETIMEILAQSDAEEN